MELNRSIGWIRLVINKLISYFYWIPLNSKPDQNKFSESNKGKQKQGQTKTRANKNKGKQKEHLQNGDFDELQLLPVTHLPTCLSAFH